MGMPLKEYIYISLIEVGDPCPSWLGLAQFSWTVVPDEIKRRLDEHQHFHSLVPMAETTGPETLFSSHHSFPTIMDCTLKM